MFLTTIVRTFLWSPHNFSGGWTIFGWRLKLREKVWIVVMGLSILWFWRRYKRMEVNVKSPQRYGVCVCVCTFTFVWSPSYWIKRAASTLLRLYYSGLDCPFWFRGQETVVRAARKWAVKWEKRRSSKNPNDSYLFSEDSGRMFTLENLIRLFRHSRAFNRKSAISVHPHLLQDAFNSIYLASRAFSKRPSILVRARVRSKQAYRDDNIEFFSSDSLYTWSFIECVFLQRLNFSHFSTPHSVSAQTLNTNCICEETPNSPATSPRLKYTLWAHVLLRAGSSIQSPSSYC